MYQDLENVYLRSFWAFASRTFDEFNFLSFAESVNITLNVVCVDKQVFAAIIWCNEAETFLNVEKLDGAF